MVTVIVYAYASICKEVCRHWLCWGGHHKGRIDMMYLSIQNIVKVCGPGGTLTNRPSDTIMECNVSLGEHIVTQ